MTRTREEILKAIEETERWAFYLDMKDRWTTEDYRTMGQIPQRNQRTRKRTCNNGGGVKPASSK